MNRRNAEAVQRFLARTDPRAIAITDFAVFSVGIYLLNRLRSDLWLRFAGLHVAEQIRIVRLAVEDYRQITENADLYNLDFDDAYQYTVAELNNLTLVSFDHHFDGTPLGRKTLGQILNAT